MPRYSRLRESELDEYYSGSLEVPRAGGPRAIPGKVDDGNPVLQGTLASNELHTIPSKEMLSSAKAHTRGSCRVEQLHAPWQNIENGNPNVTLATMQGNGTMQASAAIHAQSPGRVSLREHVIDGGSNAPIIGKAQSGGWTGRSAEERSGRLRASESELQRGDVKAITVDSSPSSGGQWTPSMKRVSSDLETALMRQQVPSQGASSTRETTLMHQQPSFQQSAISPVKTEASQDDQPRCSCQSPACKDIRPSLEFTNTSSSAQITRADSKPLGKQVERTLKTAAMAIRDGSVSDSEYDSYCGRSIAAVQRSSSTKDRSRPQSDKRSSSRRCQSSRGSRHRVSFSVVENNLISQSSEGIGHQLSFSLVENHMSLELPGPQEKCWKEPHEKCCKEPFVAHSRLLSGKKLPEQSMRYNYEQPGFVERDKTAGSGRAYTIYGVNSKRDYSNSVSGRQPSLSRAFSLRDKASTYSRISRSFSTGKHSLPRECVRCGRALGTVVHGFLQNEVSVCKSCKLPGGEWGYSEKPAKKKSIVEYCRKLFGLSKKGR